MYQTARMLDIALSRSACAVCMTRFAMRPAKSFWKNGQLWRTTCQWLCQRIRLVAPGTRALWRIDDVDEDRERPHDEHEHDHREQHRPRCASSAAWRSGASISETSRPMKSGMTVSSSATARLATNMAPYQPFVCLTKCQ